MPRQAIALEGLPRDRQAAVLDASGGASRPHRRVRVDATVAHRTSQRPRRAAAARRRRDAVPGRDLVDADALRRRLGRRVRGDQARARARRRLQGHAQVGRVGAVHRACSGSQYNAFQLGWFPDYPDPENYVLSFYQSGQLHRERVREPEDDQAAQAEQAATNDREAARASSGRSSDWPPADVPIIPYWQGNMIAVGRSNVRGIPSTLDAAFIMRYWKISKS